MRQDLIGPNRTPDTAIFIPVTNPLERLNKKVKRRADVVGIFPNEAGITRLIGAVLLRQNDEWLLQRRDMRIEGMAELSPPPIHPDPAKLPPWPPDHWPPQTPPRTHTTLTDVTGQRRRLRPGDIVLLDNLSGHKIAGAEDAMTAQGARLIYVPPYSPDLNPIEQVLAKFKAAPRKAPERTRDGLWQTIGRTLHRHLPLKCRNFLPGPVTQPDRNPL